MNIYDATLRCLEWNFIEEFYTFKCDLVLSDSAFWYFSCETFGRDSGPKNVNYLQLSVEGAEKTFMRSICPKYGEGVRD